ncbi:MAG: PDZ domain-containing protein [candidate division Zixibacteria bacterium]|nr:PDZ domain-containing protein [candidate division Zixibacteria bacterium]
MANNRTYNYSKMKHMRLVLAFLFVCAVTASAHAQNFDFERLGKAMNEYTVILEIRVELAFGSQTSEQKQRVLGTIVSTDGVVLFDGGFLDTDNAFSALSGLSIRTTPTKIEVKTLDGDKMSAEFIGVDRFTKLGFVKITSKGDQKFTPVKFASKVRFTLGTWLATYMLLPEFVSPPVAADIGMLSSIIESPEIFPLTVGFGPMEIGSVLYDSRLNPVGVVGVLTDPGNGTNDAGGFLDSYETSDFPLLGVITGERLSTVITNPPTRGKVDRAWLGITLQALTPDIAEFLKLDAKGGIIVNDVIVGSPAEKAGLKVGDVIYKIDDSPILVDREERVSVFQKRISEMGSGKTVTFGVLRPNGDDAAEITIPTTLEKAPISALDAAEYEHKPLELSVREMVFADFTFNNLDQSTFKGVVVSKIKSGTQAHIGGLQMGDIIQRIGSTPTTSVAEAEAALTAIEEEKPDEIIFFVWRDNKTMFVKVKTT